MCKMHMWIPGAQEFTSDSPSAPSDNFVPGCPTGKTSKKTNQPQASISSTESARLSYKLPFKGAVIGCMGLCCVLPWGICLSGSLPQQPLTRGEQFSSRSSRPCPPCPSPSSTMPCLPQQSSAQGAEEDLNQGTRATAGG